LVVYWGLGQPPFAATGRHVFAVFMAWAGRRYARRNGNAVSALWDS